MTVKKIQLATSALITTAEKIVGKEVNFAIIDDYMVMDRETFHALSDIHAPDFTSDPVHKGMAKFKFESANITKTRRR